MLYRYAVLQSQFPTESGGLDTFMNTPVHTSLTTMHPFLPPNAYSPFLQLAELCWAVEQTCSDPAHAELADALLTVSQMETGLLFGREELAEATR